MAGIGFRLQKLLNKDDMQSFIQAYFYSAVISCGPWIMTVLSLALITVMAPEEITSQEMGRFRIIVTYSYAFSLIVTGIFMMVITRLIADRLYIKDYAALISGCHTSGLVAVLVCGGIGAIGFSFIEATLIEKVAATAVFTFVCMIWHIMIFLGAAKDYTAIVKGFLYGSLVGIAACWYLGPRFGTTGYLVGFAIGQASVWMLLAARMMVEFPIEYIHNLNVFTAFQKFPKLIFVGLFYNLGIWADKFTFWFSDLSVTHAGVLSAYPPYDNAVFIAYLSIIPTFTVFFITMETNFARAFHDFFASITEKMNLYGIKMAHDNMGKVLDQGVISILKIQGLITVLALMFTEELADLTALAPESVGILRTTMLAVFLHSLFMVLLLIIMYFDLQGLAMGLTILFCILNWGLTYLTLDMDAAFHGFGYVAASLITTVVCYYALMVSFKSMIYRTFANQDLPEPSLEDLK